MDANTVVDLCRYALMSAVVMAAPMLVAGLIVGLIVGLLQALTQIQDQTVAFVPKLVVMALVLVLSFPWLVNRIVEFTRGVFLSAGAM
ncbi:MAG: flagellar biosynthesis protein FliQ [Rubripirellula sp.]|nr:flagellar biosynthesis protein FliQ [Rubripirellula sp.]